MKRLLAVTVAIVSLAGVTAYGDETKDLFDKTCAKCHGVDGKGDTKMGKKLNIKDMTDAKVQAALKDEVAIKNIKEGIKEGDKVMMKANDELKDDQIKALVAYVRSLKK